MTSGRNAGGKARVVALAAVGGSGLDRISRGACTNAHAHEFARVDAFAAVDDAAIDAIQERDRSQVQRRRSCGV